MKPSKEDFPLFIAQEGPLKGQRWQLSQTIVLGRESTCDVVISDRQISRYHARLTPTLEGVILEDLGSKNGTHLNGTLISTPVVLQDGDLVSVALARQFMFIVADATTPTELSTVAAEVDVDAYDKKVIKDYSKRVGSLKTLPAQRKKLEAKLRHVVKSFDVGKRYSEKRVNEILSQYHADTATLRRELVGFGLMQREGVCGEYWRV